MPGVGHRHFPYTKDGMKQAEEYAKKTGKPVKKTTKTTSTKRKAKK